MFLIKLLFVILSSIISNSTQEFSSPDYTVYIFLSEDCPICRYYVHDINELYSEFESDEIKIVGIFPNFSSKPEKIKSFVEDYQLSISTKTDYFKTISTSLGATKTPEVFITDAANHVIYKGRIDNAFAALGKRRRVVTDHNLKDILTKLQSGAEIKYSEVESIGCYINYSDLK